MKNSILISIASLFLISCTTREDIQRTQMVDNLSLQVVEGQKLYADWNTRMQDIEEKIATINGKTEEEEHQQEQVYLTQLKKLQERTTLLEESNKKLLEEIEESNKNQISQKAYLDKVLAALGQMSGKSTSKKKSSKKISEYNQAMKNYRSGKYAVAKPVLLKLLNSKKIKGNKKARIIHNLGMIEYIEKNYEVSQVYFSRLLTEYPKAPYNSNGLLYLAKSFEKSNQKDNAINTLTELINSHPKARQVKDAKALLAKLKK